MRTVEMTSDFLYRATRHRVTKFVAGAIYRRATELQAKAIVEAGAGVIVEAAPRSIETAAREGEQ